jgi:hypothetical protein
MKIPTIIVCVVIALFTTSLAYAQLVPAFESASAPGSAVLTALPSIAGPRSGLWVPAFNPQHIGWRRPQEGPRDITLQPIQECKASAGRIALGATLGLVAGAAVGFLHGAAGHPGLPHIGLDVPSELEYTP